MTVKIGTVKDLKVGGYVMINKKPCKVLNITTSSPGKHGSAKARVEAVGVLDHQRRTFVEPVGSKIKIPIIEKETAQVVSVSGDTAKLMDMEDYSTFEVSVPKELRGKLTSGMQVEYWKVSGRKLLKGTK